MNDPNKMRILSVGSLLFCLFIVLGLSFKLDSLRGQLGECTQDLAREHWMKRDER